jgi:hypothetical protein
MELKKAHNVFLGFFSGSASVTCGSGHRQSKRCWPAWSTRAKRTKVPVIWIALRRFGTPSHVPPNNPAIAVATSDSRPILVPSQIGVDGFVASLVHASLMRPVVVSLGPAFWPRKIFVSLGNAGTRGRLARLIRLFCQAPRSAASAPHAHIREIYPCWNIQSLAARR